MSIIAVIVAIMYAIGGILIGISAFLVSLPTGFLVAGVLFLIPTIVLYLEASKGGQS
jgi:hypothetical protein